MILSPSPPPQSAQPQPPMEETPRTPPESRIASLKAIFPDFDDAVILSVLESADNDHDRALDVLLGMNDPSFVPPASRPPPLPSAGRFQSDPSLDAQRLSQEALDEQFARQLALEEQEQAVARAEALQDVPSYIMYQPYQTRRGRGGRSQAQPETHGQGGKDTMTEFQEGFSRIAESGKKTFSSIMSKVRAKMQEFEHGQGSSANPPPDQAPVLSLGHQQDLGQAAYTQPSANPQRQMSQSNSAPRRAATQPVQPMSPPQPSYYDPNTQPYDLYGDDEEIQIVDNTAPAATLTTQKSPHTNSSAAPPPSEETNASPAYTSPLSSPPTVKLPETTPPVRSLSPTIASAKGTTPGAPGGVDFSKLGLLPKRPISLVQAQSPPVVTADAGAGAQRASIARSESTLVSSPDREEPEFVENPFEDRS